MLGRRHRHDELARAVALIEALNAVLAAKDAEAEEWRRLALAAGRAARDLAVAFRAALEESEVDVSDDAVALLARHWSDEVARLEEHIV